MNLLKQIRERLWGDFVETDNAGTIKYDPLAKAASGARELGEAFQRARLDLTATESQREKRPQGANTQSGIIAIALLRGERLTVQRIHDKWRKHGIIGNNVYERMREAEKKLQAWNLHCTEVDVRDGRKVHREWFIERKMLGTREAHIALAKLGGA